VKLQSFQRFMEKKASKNYLFESLTNLSLNRLQI
jgi:hypothetical protein